MLSSTNQRFHWRMNAFIHESTLSLADECFHPRINAFTGG